MPSSRRPPARTRKKPRTTQPTEVGERGRYTIVVVEERRLGGFEEGLFVGGDDGVGVVESSEDGGEVLDVLGVVGGADGVREGGAQAVVDETARRNLLALGRPDLFLLLLRGWRRHADDVRVSLRRRPRTLFEEVRRGLGPPSGGGGDGSRRRLRDASLQKRVVVGDGLGPQCFEAFVAEFELDDLGFELGEAVPQRVVFAARRREVRRRRGRVTFCG
mmetsp:Transcript_119/g.317  ORF Transcript_119/g.317 Transcript_119/m.317 type:complete len:218 (-) Transcript_119:484-1137(-)